MTERWDKATFYFINRSSGLTIQLSKAIFPLFLQLTLKKKLWSFKLWRF
ncbi:hypothetical protein Pcar_3416 [Syntrophotalea carbinolica DSM 2380]|uniref:Uncharacterized protein n=1 Tax=Syntrophotalea carbinolica (strain DSM 2380 / NBRC 103641 / GraBd1) TaxID=338963 RepID=J9TJA6_SYNC1|nr:hypothetical protein Pcar_3416 [Syntrophotalea carbinolica DSM 2380]